MSAIASTISADIGSNNTPAIVAQPATAMVVLADVSTFTFDSLAYAASVYVNTPKGIRARLAPANCAIQLDGSAENALAAELTALGLAYSVSRNRVPAQIAWN